MLIKELNETKDLLNSLQTMVIDNNSKLLSLSLEGNFSNTFDNEFVSMDNVTDLNQEEEQVEEELDNEIVGTNLKELIENEINLDI